MYVFIKTEHNEGYQQIFRIYFFVCEMEDVHLETFCI